VGETDELKILFTLEPKWTASLNGVEFLPLESSEISIEGSTIRLGRYSRIITELEWLRPNVIRIRGRARSRSQVDTIMLYAGDRLPSGADLRRRRRAFQIQIGRALCEYFGVRNIQREMLYSDRQHGVGGAYPRFFCGKHAAIAVDPDESSSVVNGLMRAALLWAPLVHRPVTAVLPRGRHQCLSARLRLLARMERTIRWAQWDGSRIEALPESADEPETYVQPFALPDAESEVCRICALAPDLLRALPYIPGSAISIRLRGIEVARVTKEGTLYPLGEPLPRVIEELDQTRRYGSRHPLARAHEERWLESNVVGAIRQLIPSVDARHVYPQVPSFIGEERNIIDLLTITTDGRLVVIEIKAAPDPDLPFQALDYWIAVERHRKTGDFVDKGYFSGCAMRDQPALLILIAPLLSYHKTSRQFVELLPPQVPVMEIGINQSWKREIKVLRRKGTLS
jgi:hypothetical protein